MNKVWGIKMTNDKLINMINSLREICKELNTINYYDIQYYIDSAGRNIGHAIEKLQLEIGKNMTNFDNCNE